MKHETLDQKKARRAVAARGKVVEIRDRRRFKTTPVPLGDGGVVAPRDAIGTIFTSRVFDVADEPVFKDGAHNSKIGGDVLVGRLKGAHIVTLTLEERATCPSACALWQTCYGNSMPHSRRWRHGPVLEARIETEIAELCTKHERVLVRLHVLGGLLQQSLRPLVVESLNQAPQSSRLRVHGVGARKRDRARHRSGTQAFAPAMVHPAQRPLWGVG
jgi:hypothetical protein